MKRLLLLPIIMSLVACGASGGVALDPKGIYDGTATQDGGGPSSSIRIVITGNSQNEVDLYQFQGTQYVPIGVGTGSLSGKTFSFNAVSQANSFVGTGDIVGNTYSGTYTLNSPANGGQSTGAFTTTKAF